MISFFVGAIIAIIIYGLVYFHEKKYTDFVEQNSIALKKLFEINEELSFFPYVDLDQTHTYDNEKFYDTISCSDFLIYQLQYISKKIYEQVEKININKKEHQKYLNDINSIEFGQFEAPIGKLKLDKLLKKEKRKIEENICKVPATHFSITVTLYCATINGRIYNKKRQNFAVDEIFSLIKRLKNKKGSFYNDREIWDSLCRVERGKVFNKMRFSIYERDHYRCCRCGTSDRYANLEIDHIIPIAKGGKTTYDNLQTLCHRCNYEKGDRVYY